MIKLGQNTKKMIRVQNDSTILCPTDLEAIVQDELLNVFYDDYGDDTFDGLTIFEPSTDEFYIHINTARGNRRGSAKGRFTLAHELGHYFLPLHRLALMRGAMQPHGSINYLIDNNSWKLEREADRYASSLLMPERPFVTFIRGKKFNFQLVCELVDLFKVSISAAVLRFAEIGNHPIMVLYGVDKKIRWVRRSQDFPFWRLRYGNNKDAIIPENTVIGDYFYRNDTSCCKNEEIVYAKDCFDTFREEDNFREFKEWCIPYNNRALSVFWE